MAYTLEQLSDDIRKALKTDSGVTGKQAICGLVSKVLLDKDFVAKHLTADQCRPRKVLFEDPELGFCVCGHVYESAAHGGPHDHGSSWAIAGLASAAANKAMDAETAYLMNASLSSRSEGILQQKWRPGRTVQAAAEIK